MAVYPRRWHNVVVWRYQAENPERVKKGFGLWKERLHTENIKTSDGQKIYPLK